MTTKELNREELKTLASKNDTSEAIFSMLALRQRNRTDTDLRRLKNELIDEGFKVIPDEFINTFRSLDRMGVGKLITKPGSPARFKWNYAMKEVGKMAVNEKAATKPPVSEVPKTEVKKDTSTRISVKLESGNTVDLPAFLSVSEAKALAAIILRSAEK